MKIRLTDPEEGVQIIKQDGSVIELTEITLRSTRVQNVSADTVNITTDIEPGQIETVIYKNVGSRDYLLSVDSSYITADGNEIRISCPVSGYCEINYIKISNNETYARLIYGEEYKASYFTFVAKGDGSYSFTKALSYSQDNGETWTEVAANTSISTTNGSETLFKAELTPVSQGGIGSFSSTVDFDAKGNIMSLLYGDDFLGQTDLTGKNYCFYNLFKNNTHLISVESLELPATTLSNYCYQLMFSGCTSLINAPVLPATTLTEYCYGSMFFGCTSLVTPPVLPATTLARGCYQNLFRSCTGLTTPPALPATTLANDCYQRTFHGCTSLATAPELPATDLYYNCYGQMFYGCTSLEIAPELPATTVTQDCYGQMFMNCTNLSTAPELPATTLATRCYAEMFNNCNNISYIKALFETTPGSDYTNNWVRNVSSSGTFVKSANATWDVRGNNGVPNNWTVETE